MLTTNCVLSFTEVVVKKAQKLYDEHREASSHVVVLPKWTELPHQSQLGWMKIAKCQEIPRQNKLMP